MVLSSFRQNKCDNISHELRFRWMMRRRSATLAGGLEKVLRSGRPGEPRRIAARKADAAWNTRGERRRAEAARHQRIGAEIFDRGDFRAHAALEPERDMLWTNAECKARAFRRCYRRAVGSGDNGAAAAWLER